MKSKTVAVIIGCIFLVGLIWFLEDRVNHIERDIDELIEIVEGLNASDNLMCDHFHDALSMAQESNVKLIEDYNKHLLMRLNAQMVLTRSTRDSISDVNDFLQARISNSNSNLSSFRARMGHRIDGFQDRIREEFDNLPSNLIPVLARELTPSVVKINVKLGLHAYSGKKIGWSGSGVFIERDLILTAGHVVDIEGALAQLSYTLDQEYHYKVGPVVTVELVDGTVLEVLDYYMEDPRITDVGLIQVKVKDCSIPEVKLLVPRPLPFGYAEIGETVMAIGGPFGFYPSVTSGIVSALDVDDEEDFWGEANLIQSDTPLNPGNSGCPLFNMNGEIIGIHVGGMEGGDGFGVQIPADICMMVIEKYKSLRALEAVE